MPDLPAESMLAAVRELGEVESPSLDKVRCDRCADRVADLFGHLAEAEVTRHRRPERGDHVEVKIGRGLEPIVILCHHDTVWEEGTLARLPFRVDGNRVTGPGTY